MQKVFSDKFRIKIDQDTNTVQISIQVTENTVQVHRVPLNEFDQAVQLYLSERAGD